MKVIIDGYEVEIKAKKVGGTKTTTKDTMHILSEIEGWVWTSARYAEQSGFSALANAERDSAMNIHETLNRCGFFDNIRRA